MKINELDDYFDYITTYFTLTHPQRNLHYKTWQPPRITPPLLSLPSSSSCRDDENLCHLHETTFGVTSCLMIYPRETGPVLVTLFSESAKLTELSRC